MRFSSTLTQAILVAFYGSSICSEVYNVTLTSQNERSVKLESHGDDHTDEYALSANGFLNLRNSKFSDDKLILSYRMGLVKIVEFNSTISPLDSSSICNLTNQDKLFSNFTSKSFSDSSENDAYLVETSFSGSTDCPGLSISIDVASVPSLIRMNDRDLNPDEANWWLTITGFPYKYENSSLAIVHYASSTEVMQIDADNRRIIVGQTGYIYDYGFDQIFDDNETPVKCSIFNDSFQDSDVEIDSDELEMSGEQAKLFYVTIPAEQPEKVRFTASFSQMESASGDSDTGKESNNSFDWQHPSVTLLGLGALLFFSLFY